MNSRPYPYLPWTRPVEEATFVRRYKRFFADVILANGAEAVAHVANSGSLKSVQIQGAKCLVSFHDDPSRKLKYGLEAIAGAGGWIGVNTSHPNRLAEHAVVHKIFPRWEPYKNFAREIKISAQSRTDLVLWQDTIGGSRPTLEEIRSVHGPRFHFVEVKNVTYAEGPRALFPDSVTSRGLKHVEEFEGLMELGHTAEFLFIIQRQDIEHFAPAHAIDPDYAEALVRAEAKGLKVSAHIVDIGPDGLLIREQMIPYHPK